MKKYKVVIVLITELEAKLNELSAPNKDLQVLIKNDTEAIIICSTTLQKKDVDRRIEPRAVNSQSKLSTFYQAI
jgi:hypothetical protein